MGLFDVFKNKNNGNDERENNNTYETSNAVTPERNETSVEYAPTNGLLNLTKNSVLDLTKYSDTLNNVRVSAGWDVNKRYGSDYDLDLCAYLMSNGKLKHTVYYGEQKSTGIYLDKDNLTGEGDGDDENIHIKLKDIPSNIDSIIFGVVIYSASSRNQCFKDVKNAYVRLVDEDNRGKEICKYKLSEDGGSNTAVTFSELYRTSNGWAFKAIGDYSKNAIGSLGDSLNRR